MDRSLFLRRAAARVLDSVALAVLSSAVLGFYVEEQADGDRVLDAPPGIVAAIIVGVFLYECLPLRAVGATPGKIAARLRVRMVDGGELTWRAAALRALVPAVVIAICVASVLRGLMPAVLAGLYATAFGSKTGRGAVDIAAGTVVERA